MTILIEFKTKLRYLKIT